LDETAKLVRQLLGPLTQAHVPYENRGKHGLSAADLSESDRALLTEWNGVDYALHEYAKQRVSDDYRRLMDAK
jgi:hypothetical protein